MELTILGSGTCVPSMERGSPANFLKIGGSAVLVDCGPGTLRQLEKAKLSYKNIDFVFVTHFHPDHISDINALIQALNWTPNYDRKKNLVLVGPAGFSKFYGSLIRPVSGNPRPNTYKIIIKEIEDRLEFDGFEVECVRTIHAENSIAYRFQEGAKSLVISGDCDYDGGLAKFSEKADVLLLECSFPGNMKTKGHLVPAECAAIAKKAGVKRLVLTHLYPVLSGKNALAESRKIFPDTIVARDLVSIKI